MDRTWSCFDCRFDDAEPVCFTAGGSVRSASPRPHAAEDPRARRSAGAEDRSHARLRLRRRDGAGRARRGRRIHSRRARRVPDRRPRRAARGGRARNAAQSATARKSSARWSARRASTPRCATCCRRRGARSSIAPGVWARLVAAVAPGPVMDADARTPAAGLHDKVLDAAARRAARRADGMSLRARRISLRPAREQPIRPARTVIYVDADACPVKDEAVRVAERHGLPSISCRTPSCGCPRAR